MTDTPPPVERTTPIVDLVEDPDPHDASTRVAAFPPELLDALKGVGAPPEDRVVDLTGDFHEPETLQLETVLLAMPATPSAELDPPAETIELYIERLAPVGTLAGLEQDLAGVPRRWKIAAVLAAAAISAGVAFALSSLLPP